MIAFVVTASLLLIATGLVGSMVDGPAYFDHHFAMGLVTALFVCLGHVAVFTYFMATGKMIKLAVEDAALPVELFERARRDKERAFRAVMAGIILVLSAALSGGWVTYRPEWSRLHLVMVLAASAGQLAVWWIEFDAVSGNGRLMDEVFDRHARIKESRR
ncbi:MAG: hypothetical protein AMXMBFR83_00430 [Phycisphaerae bacterium]